MNKVKVGDIVMVKKQSHYREGMIGGDERRASTYTTKYKVLQLAYEETGDPCVQINISPITGTWWFRLTDMIIVSKKVKIGGELL